VFTALTLFRVRGTHPNFSDTPQHTKFRARYHLMLGLGRPRCVIPPTLTWSNLVHVYKPYLSLYMAFLVISLPFYLFLTLSVAPSTLERACSPGSSVRGSALAVARRRRIWLSATWAAELDGGTGRRLSRRGATRAGMSGKAH
jgi:hypothetical protein